MKTRYLEDGLLIGATKLEAKTNNESIIYTKDEDFIKIYYSQLATRERKKAIMLLEEFDDDECCIPKYLVNDGYRFKGLGAPLYRDYICLEDTMDTISFKDRYIIARKTALLIESFKKKKYAYYDVHPGNIMVKDTNIKLIDMDGGYFRSTHSAEYNIGQNKSYMYLCGLILSLLYGIDDPRFAFNDIVQDNVDMFKRTANAKQMRLVEATITHNGINFLPSEFIDYFPEEYIEETKPMLML